MSPLRALNPFTSWLPSGNFSIYLLSQNVHVDVFSLMISSLKSLQAVKTPVNTFSAPSVLVLFYKWWVVLISKRVVD